MVSESDTGKGGDEGERKEKRSMRELRRKIGRYDAEILSLVALLLAVAALAVNIAKLMSIL